MPNLLITPTLLNNFSFAKTAPYTWRERAIASLTRTIKREPFQANDIIERGMEFEDTLQAVCEYTKRAKLSEVTKGTPMFKQVANICLPGIFQKIYKKKLTIDGHEYLVYCKVDVDLPDTIVDVKTTSNFKGKRKYLSGWQHILYLWASGKNLFRYIVVEFENDRSNNIHDVHDISYTPFSQKDLEIQIKDVTKEAVQFFRNKNLYEDYYFTFSKNN